MKTIIATVAMTIMLSMITSNLQAQSKHHRKPPQEAFQACESKSDGDTCEVTTRKGTLTGTCLTPPNSSELVCAPEGMAKGERMHK